MAFFSASSGKTAYGVKRLFLDTIDDLLKVNTTNLYPGTTAFIIDASTNDMLNNKKVWVKVNLSSGNGSNSGDGDLPENIIYDGGVVVG